MIGAVGYMVITAASGWTSSPHHQPFSGLTLLFDSARRVAQFFAMLQANLIILDSPSLHMRAEPRSVTWRMRRCVSIEFEYHSRGCQFRLHETRCLCSKSLDMTLTGGKIIRYRRATGSGKTRILSLITKALRRIDGGWQYHCGENIATAR